MDRRFTREKQVSHESVFGFIESQDLQILLHVWRADLHDCGVGRLNVHVLCAALPQG